MMFVDNCKNSTQDQENGILQRNCQTHAQNEPGNPGVRLVVRLCVENVKHNIFSFETADFMVLVRFHVVIEFLPTVY